MYLGIEIGGTKLQLGIGAGDGGPLQSLVRCDVQPQNGAAGILEQIEVAGVALLQRFPVSKIGIGFAGPVDAATGRVLKSHQIKGWENVELTAWCERSLGAPAVIGNDCDVAALAEAKFGAGAGAQRVFYLTVGAGVGGGMVVDGATMGAGRPAIAEIGHLRPGLHADRPGMTVESIASGWGISAAAQARLAGDVSRPLEMLHRTSGHVDRSNVKERLESAGAADEEYLSDLLRRCDNSPQQLTASHVAQAAAEGNQAAREIMQHATTATGWAIATVITLLAPEIVVIGGGVTQCGEQQFFEPVRAATAAYVFPPLKDSYRILPAALDQTGIVHGALALAAATATGGV